MPMRIRVTIGIEKAPLTSKTCAEGAEIACEVHTMAAARMSDTRIKKWQFAGSFFRKA